MEILRCAKCGYDLYPDDTICDRCKTPVNDGFVDDGYGTPSDTKGADDKKASSGKDKKKKKDSAEAAKDKKTATPDAEVINKRRLPVPALIAIIVGAVLLVAGITALIVFLLLREPDTGGFSYAGTWEIDHVEYHGLKVSMEKLEELGYDYLSDITVIISDSGDAYIDGSYYSEVVEWEETYDGILAGDWELIRKGKKLYFEEDEDTKVFLVKISDDQYIDESLLEDEYYDDYEEYYEDEDEDYYEEEEEDYEDIEEEEPEEEDEYEEDDLFYYGEDEEEDEFDDEDIEEIDEEGEIESEDEEPEEEDENYEDEDYDESEDYDEDYDYDELEA